MKKLIYISGIVIINFFVIGALFKILHWPGAGILITLGLGLFCLGFLPLAFIQSYKGNGKKNKSLYLAGFICVFITLLGALFKIQHWHGANWFLIFGIPLPFLYFLPIYIYHHNKLKEKSSVNFVGVMFMMVYIAVFSAILAINVSRDILVAFCTGDEDIVKTNNLFTEKNKLMYDKLEKVGIVENQKKIAQLKIKSEVICTNINKIKVELVKSAENSDSQALDSENKINTDAIIAKDESAGTTHIMRGSDGVSGKAIELKGLINDYREYLISFIGNNNENSKYINNLLSTSDITETIYSEVYTTKWEDSFFPNGTFIVTVLCNLDCIETNVKMAEAEALSYLSENKKQ